MPYISATTRAMAATTGEAASPVRAYKHDGNELTVQDWFCGAGGSSQGADAVPNVRVTRAANHWKKALESHMENFPGIAHYMGDIRKAPVWAWPVADIHWGSPECFPAGTLILTRTGLVPIEEVQVGDEVFTHERRWRPVTATMRKTAETLMVTGVGHVGGLETTAEHPFYSRPRARVYQDRKRGYRWRPAGPAEWTDAKNLEGRMWATPIDFGSALPVPPVGGRGIEQTPDFWWMVGRWLGDGSLRFKPKTEAPLTPETRLRSQPAGSACVVCGGTARPYGTSTTGRVSPYCSTTCKRKNSRKSERGRYEVVVSCGQHEAEELGARLTRTVGLRWAQRTTRTAVNFTTGHRGLTEWLVEHFGQHAQGKTIPAWALTMQVESRRALLDGYLSADGHTGDVYTQTSTVSKRLAIGVRMLANSLGHVANLYGPYVRKGVRAIEGRVIKERPHWQLNWITDGPRHAFHVDEDGYRWAPVKTVEPTGRTVEVFNLSVADDESYVADGVTVHNCTNWSIAQGKKRSFAKAVQGDLLDLYAEMEGEKFQAKDDEPDSGPTEEEEASRALMEEIPLYLRGVIERGKLVKAGVVENVVDVRKWWEWDRWLAEFHKLGYRTKLIALNSMHADPRSVHKAPQSRDRLYLVYWHKSLGRTPDWEKWLSPRAYCTGCDVWVQARQVFRRPGVDMGRYKSQYDYRCPNTKCGHQIVEPEVLPAAAAIDWSVPGIRIGDREQHGLWPLAEKTRRRIQAGLDKFAKPVIVPTGGTWRTEGAGVDQPMATRTTRENDGLAVPPFLVPCDGRDGKTPKPVYGPMHTQTGRQETALAWLPFIAEIRGGSSDARAIDDPLATVCASGNHHGLVTPPAMVMRNNGSVGDGGEHCTSVGEPLRTMTTTGHQSLVTWEPLLMPYYGNGQAKPVSEPVGALSTRDRYALVSGEIDIDDVLFRMLQPHEIQRAMAFADSYVVLGSKRDRVKQLGNAVTPNVAEVLICALAECITGEPIDRYALAS